MRRVQWIMLWLVVFVAVAALLIGLLTPTLPAKSPANSDAGSPGSRPGPRIVAMSPALGVIVADLGLGDRIVGRHAFDVSLDASIPVVGDINGIDYERLLRLDPTHILLERSAQPLPDRLLNLASDNGWIIRSIPLLALDDIPLATTQLADLFDSPATRRRHTTLLAQFKETMRPNREIAQRVGRVLPLFWTSPPSAAGPGSFHYEMLERLGFRMALTEGGPFITLDPEDILRLDPDSILLLTPGADPARLDELLGPLGRLDLRCVREGRVGVVSDPMVNIPATSILGVVLEVLEITAKWQPPATPAAN